MKITFLGTGGAFTDYRLNYHNNAVVPTSEGYVLIDCGGTAVQSLKELGIPLEQVYGVIVTHLHGDHIGGLEQLIWERYYGMGPNGMPRFQSTLLIAAQNVHPGLRRSLSDCVDEYTGPDARQHRGGYDALTVSLTLPTHTPLEVGGVIFTLHPTPHVEGPGVSKPTYSVDIRNEDGWFHFTSDTTYRPETFRNGDVVFHDCTFSSKYPGTVHTHYSDLLQSRGRDRIVLMHHTKVPDHVSPEADGFLCAAHRHDTFEILDRGKSLNLYKAGAIHRRWKHGLTGWAPSEE
jgi:ribonuclease BN (tRNA processing enzyme)